MLKGCKGQKRPADVIGDAIKVIRIATGQTEEEHDEDGKNKAAQALGRKGGKPGVKIVSGAAETDRAEGSGEALGEVMTG